MPDNIKPEYVLLAMKQYGGEFVRTLGDAGLHTNDPENVQLIATTWPTIWEFYTKMAEQVWLETASKHENCS